MKITPAIERVLEKAYENNAIHVMGGFNDTKPPVRDLNFLYDDKETGHLSNFDHRKYFDRCINAGFLRFGDAWNTYHITDAGKRAFEDVLTRRRVRAAKERVREEKRNTRAMSRV